MQVGFRMHDDGRGTTSRIEAIIGRNKMYDLDSHTCIISISFQRRYQSIAYSPSDLLDIIGRVRRR